ncbi:hypothetical protein H8I69_18565 [Serratia fonticola]|uniref:hypothetical protein n=1 Tax=Serratia fonticola TaxID=47917 RepID=UPI0015C5EC60|nr:hypothetical protein [Serratia fonticola]MBC3381127.1 hypothetical protein [Serratia fonticola]NYA40326.1 hypothetical protein [Serratia fonticola]
MNKHWYKKKALLLPVLLMLSACDDISNVDKIRNITIPAQGDIPLGELLEGRPVCDKTEWITLEGEASTQQVEYHCEFSVLQTGDLFSHQLSTWIARNTQRITAAEKQQLDALDSQIKARQTITLARQVYQHLQASGELVKYKAIVQDSPVDNMSLDAVKAFYSSPDSDEDIAGRLAGNPTVRETIDTIYNAVTEVGLSASTPQGDACQAPANLMLAVTSSDAEIEQSFSDCLTRVEKTFKNGMAEAEDKIKMATSRLNKINNKMSLRSFRETVRWDLIPEKIPTVSYHGLEMAVQQGDQTRRFTRSLAIDDDTFISVYDGKFNDYYHNIFIGMMSDLVR